MGDIARNEDQVGAVASLNFGLYLLKNILKQFALAVVIPAHVKIGKMQPPNKIARHGWCCPPAKQVLLAPVGTFSLAGPSDFLDFQGRHDTLVEAALKLIIIFDENGVFCSHRPPSVLSLASSV
jgi:hypothetical protein